MSRCLILSASRPRGLAKMLAVIVTTMLALPAARAQTPNYPPASPLQSSITQTPSAEMYPYFQLKVDKDRGFSTNETVALPTSDTYTAAGAIALTDHKAMVNCAAACTMTLAAGTIDGYPLIIKRAPGSAGTPTISANIDGAAATPTLAANGVMRLRWDAQFSTWDSE